MAALAICAVENLSFSYPGAGKAALRDLNLSVAAGEFIVFCGRSGSGKTTLLRMLKRELSPHGERSGRVFYRDKPLEEWDGRTLAGGIGLVGQQPGAQIVTDQVWSELAFGPENLGLPAGEIRRRVGETAAYFGLETRFRSPTASLSDGQKQQLNLAAAMAMRPEVLLLDEPTSQLDPLSAAGFLDSLRRLHADLGVTVLLTEHRLDEVLPLADRVVMLEQGGIVYAGPPAGLSAAIPADNPLSGALPAPMRLHRLLGWDGPPPLTAGAARARLGERYRPEPETIPEKASENRGAPVITVKQVWYRYKKESPDILRGTDLTVYAGENYCLFGGNGSGKTTLLRLLAVAVKPYRGKVSCNEKIGWLPQNPADLFVCPTIGGDFAAAGVEFEETVARFGVLGLMDRHPYDVSGGEIQLCALALLMLRRPKILLLDEPTKGIDSGAKAALTALLKELAAAGAAVLTVTHDPDFAAGLADRCGLLFDGEILSEDARDFFVGNSYYTTAANRMARHLFAGAVTVEEAAERCNVQLGGTS